MKLWKKMNNWVYDGFEKTYKSLNVEFDKNYYESSTYLLGKKNVDQGLSKKIFYKEKDNSVWIDLTEETFRKVFKESPIKRSKFKGLKRNINYVR